MPCAPLPPIQTIDPAYCSVLARSPRTSHRLPPLEGKRTAPPTRADALLPPLPRSRAELLVPCCRPRPVPAPYSRWHAQSSPRPVPCCRRPTLSAWAEVLLPPTRADIPAPCCHRPWAEVLLLRGLGRGVAAAGLLSSGGPRALLPPACLSGGGSCALCCRCGPRSPCPTAGRSSPRPMSSEDMAASKG